jgi:chain length determinant protein tyrosine kinase EpsG
MAIDELTVDNSALDHGRSIDAILVEHGLLDPRNVESVQKYALERGIRFGDAAIQLKFITYDDLEFALARQFKLPQFEPGNNGVAEEVVTAHGPQSEFVEPIRGLRTQLMVRWLPNARRRILALTSPSRGEGRSWLAANLAVAFAQAGMRTLLIDADMRNPQQHRLFNLGNSPGLSALLTEWGRAPRGRAPTGHRIHPQLRLFVLPAGQVPPNPQELLAGSAFSLVLDRFAELYDGGIVLIDTPAAAENSDAQLIVAKAGAAFVLGRRNYTRHGKLSSTMRDLESTGANIVGCVLNDY